jgi:hypothetical protein
VVDETLGRDGFLPVGTSARQEAKHLFAAARVTRGVTRGGRSQASSDDRTSTRHGNGPERSVAETAAGGYHGSDSRRLPVVAPRIVVPAVVRHVPRSHRPAVFVIAIPLLDRSAPGPVDARLPPLLLGTGRRPAAGGERRAGDAREKRNPDGSTLLHADQMVARPATRSGDAPGTGCRASPRTNARPERSPARSDPGRRRRRRSLAPC